MTGTKDKALSRQWAITRPSPLLCLASKRQSQTRHWRLRDLAACCRSMLSTNAPIFCCPVTNDARSNLCTSTMLITNRIEAIMFRGNFAVEELSSCVETAREARQACEAPTNFSRETREYKTFQNQTFMREMRHARSPTYHLFVILSPTSQGKLSRFCFAAGALCCRCSMGQLSLDLQEECCSQQHQPL